MKVPFLDLEAQYAPIRADVDAAVRAVFDDTAFILGPAVERFESAFAAYVGAEHCVGVSSGTSALHLALLAAGVRAGDEVVTTPHTWISTTWAISYCGARPVYADVDPATGNLNPELAEAAITDRTRVVLPVDLYGNPAEHADFERIAADGDLMLIDDAAQAHGAKLGERQIGTFGAATCFSFYPGKNLGAAGEGGAVVTNDAGMAAHMRRLRDHAQDGRHHHVEVGYNYRMDGVQAAVLLTKLPHLDGWNEARRTAAARYDELLSDVVDVKPAASTPTAVPVHHLYVVRVDDRDRLAESLGAAGIATGVHYPRPVHLQPAYAALGYGQGSFPNAEAFAASCLSLPMYPEITVEQQEYVVEMLALAIEG